MSPRLADTALLDDAGTQAMPRPRAGAFAIPGQPFSLEWRRNDEGRLVELRCGLRTHLVERDGVRCFGDGLADVSEWLDGPRLLRVVHTRHGSWVETHRVDGSGRVSHVDGVDIERDRAGRIVRAGAWTYGYVGDNLVTVEGPNGVRRIDRDGRGRVVAINDRAGTRHCAYDQAGLRTDAARLPGTFHRDALGRLWTVTDGAGRVVATYLWEGTSCLARIDGDAREPVAAVFSLDPTGTPVRVVEVAGNRRLPRDAFGEGLLAERGVPGLFGAVVHAGLHYLPARALDPCTGSFCSPDPWNAGPGDPRRVDGRDVPLAVEQPGEYVVCRNDPIGRTDPTGCTSGYAALVAFSSLTWASPTTIFGILGFDLGVNFWLSLFSGKIGDYFGSFGDGMAARRHGGFAVRRGGLLGLSRAYTIGHYVMHDAASYRSYDLISCFVPDAAMPLVGYGTLLRLVARDGSTFLLDGSSGIPNVTAARGWTRGGGVGTPLYPGATVARYDSGGLHIDRNVSTASSSNLNTSGFNMASKSVFGPQACTLDELAPTGVWAAGFSLSNLITVTLQGTGLGISVGNLVALTHTTASPSGPSPIDSATIAEVTNVVETGGSTELTLASSGSGVLTPLRLRTLGPPGAAENASAVAGQPTYLSTAGTTAAYTAGDPLRLSQTGAAGRAPVGAAVVLRLEAQLAIDAPLPPNTALSFTLLVPGTGGGPASVSAPTTITCSAAVPAVPSLLAITTPGGTVPVAATAIADNPAGGKDVTLDRAITLTGSGTWAPLVANASAFGSAQQADAAATITYQPAAPRTTPAAGAFIRIDASNAPATARAVTGVTYDALVLSALPGNTGLPYSVERFPFLSVDQDELTFNTKSGFAIDATLTPLANQTLPGLALRLHELAGPTLAAAAAGVPSALSGVTLTVAGASLTASLSSTPTVANPAPGQLMLLSDGGATLELTVVTGIRLTVNCDRAWNGKASALEAIPIADGGPTYPATLVSGSSTLDVTLGSAVPSGANSIVTEMPRIGVGEIVRLRWTDGAANLSEFYRVSAVESLVNAAGAVLVDSTTVTLTDGGILPSATASAFTLTRQVPQAPSTGTGSSREGLNGDLIPSTTGGNPQMAFSVWGVGALSSGTFAISDGTTARPMRFAAPSGAAPRGLTIQLGAAPTAFASGTTPTLRVPALATAPAPPPTPPAFASTVYAARFTQAGNTVNFTVHADELNVLAPATGNIVVAVSFDVAATSGTPPMIATAVPGSVQPGTVLIPEDTSYELTVKEGLVEHETRHTMQYSWLGPLMWGLYPILPQLDKAYPGLDSADYSAYFDAVLSTEGGFSTLRCSNLGATTLEKGDAVASALNTIVELGARNEKVKDPAGTFSFVISDADFQTMKRIADANGKLSVRKRLHGTAGHVGNVFLRDVPVFLTPGGLTEFALSSTWGWFIYGFARLFYAMDRSNSGTSGTTYDGTVSADGAAILVEDAAGRNALEDASRIMVQFEKSTVVRTATAGEGDTPLVMKLSLAEPLPDLKGKKVQVALWDSHQPASSWDWNTYFPATVPDPKKPASVKLLPADADGKKTLALNVQDTVLIRTGAESKRTVVTAVNADGTVDFEDPPQLALAGDKTLDKEFRVAKVGEHDPLGSLGGLFANLQGAPWLGKLVDPWAWVFSAPNLKPGSGGEWAMRVLRWIGSSHAWSMIFPGVLWIDDLFKGAGSFSAWMEQDASENSGDLYSSIGRFEHRPALVGDIGRYWFFPNGRFLSSYMTTVGTSRRRSLAFDAAGSQMNREVVVSPFVTAETSGGAPTINKGAGSPAPATTPPGGSTTLPAGAGDAVPDALYAKSAGDPRLPSVTSTPSSFLPTDRGLIPVSGALERTEGIYVAYSRPGTHRATILETFLAGTLGTEIQDSRSVVDSGAGFGLMDVTLFFDTVIADIGVTIGGITVNNDDVVTLVLTQAAKVSVTPVDAARRYALTLQRPLTGALLQADQAGNDPTTIQVQAPARLPTAATERVELCRIYRYDAGTDAYDEPSLNTRRLNLPGDLRVPVRRFTVQVTNTITARSAVSPRAADDVSGVTVGTDVFVLVPATIATPLSTAISYSPAAPPATQNPVLTVDTVPIPDDLAKAGVVGTAFRVHSEAGDPPEVPATVALSVDVGSGGLTGTLTGSLTLNPAFTLEGTGGFTVARGSTLVLTAKDLASADVNVSAVDPLADVTVTFAGATITLVVAGSAVPGTRRVLAALASDATGATKAARTITIT